MILINTNPLLYQSDIKGNTFMIMDFNHLLIYFSVLKCKKLMIQLFS